MKKPDKTLFNIKPSPFTEFCGWYGMLALIVAYGLVSFELIQANGLAFQLLNLSGGLGLIIVAASKNVLQSVLLNMFWITIGIITVIRIIY